MESNNEVILGLRGSGAAEAADVLVRRLGELGHEARSQDHLVFLRFEGKAVAGWEYELGVYDPPEFSAEKILDDLAVRGWITLEAPEWTAAEEAGIRDRLKGLGYVE